MKTKIDKAIGKTKVKTVGSVAKNITPKPIEKKVPKNTIIREAKVELTSFTIGAVIPVQSFGDIRPTMTFTAPSVEAVLDVAMPIIEKLYQTYAEAPRDGRVVSWFNRANVTVKETVITPQSNGSVTHVQTAPIAPQTTTPVAPQATAKAENTPVGHTAPVAPVDGPAVKTEAYTKAENAIRTSMSPEALDKTIEAIEKSVKVNQEDKHFLITLGLKKHKEFANK